LFAVPLRHPAWPGKGVRATRPIAAGTEVGHYAGALRAGCIAPENAYLMNVSCVEAPDLVIDALMVGNLTRYINDPRGMGRHVAANLQTEDATYYSGATVVRGVLLRATRDIEPGEELLYHYEEGGAGYWADADAQIIDLSAEPWSHVKRERSDVDIDLVAVESPAPSWMSIFKRLATRMDRFDAVHHEAVNVGSQDVLLSAARQVLAECVAAATADEAQPRRRGDDDDEHTMPADLFHYEIPAGYKRCCGPCRRVKPNTAAHFRRDVSKVSGLRGRCKQCESIKNK